tara:strand:+ start:888 stop:1082 length:195 start_codon:yes stop_codon:yes gene_type:complete
MRNALETKELKTYVENFGWVTVYYRGPEGREKPIVFKVAGDLIDAQLASYTLKLAALDAIEEFA